MRRNAAARKAPRDALQDQPQILSKTVDADLQSATLQALEAGWAHEPGWRQGRALGHTKAMARAAWAVAGARDGSGPGLVNLEPDLDARWAEVALHHLRQVRSVWTGPLGV